MDCGENIGSKGRGNEPPPLPGYAELLAKESLRSSCTEADENSRADEMNLRFEPRPACKNLGVARFLVNSTLPLPGAYPTEMFHRICNVDVGPVDPDPFQRVIEQLSRGADEWPSRNILSVSRLFSHEHDFGIYTAFAENCLICSLPKITSLAGARCATQRRERKLGRNESAGSGVFR